MLLCEPHGTEDKCTQSEAEFQEFLDRKGIVVRKLVSRGGDMFVQDIGRTLLSTRCGIQLLYNEILSVQLFYLHSNIAAGEQNGVSLASCLAEIGRDNSFQNLVIRGTVARNGDFALMG